MPNQISKDQAANTRKFYEGVLSSLNSLHPAAQSLGEPFLGLYTGFKAQCNAELKKLEPTDQAGLSLEFDSILSGLASAMVNVQAICGMLSEGMLKAREAADPTRLQAQLCSAVDEAVKKQITEGLLIPKDVLESRIASGELKTKEVVTEMCSQARTAGLEEGEKKVRTEMTELENQRQLASNRRVQVEKAGLPIPTAELEAILGADESAFTAAQTKAATRLGFLNERQVSLNSPLRSKVWGSDLEWQGIETALKEVEVPSGRSRVNPLAGNIGPAQSARPRCSV